MRVARNIMAVPIILLVLMPCIYCLYFQARHQAIKWEMQERLESERLQTIIIPAKNFRWYEQGREIIVNGAMFDVRSVTKQDGNYLVTGLFDEEETELHIAMGRLQEEQGDMAPDASLLPVILSQTLMPFSVETNLTLSETGDEGAYLEGGNETLCNTFLSIQTPPPRS